MTSKMKRPHICADCGVAFDLKDEQTKQSTPVCPNCREDRDYDKPIIYEFECADGTVQKYEVIGRVR